MRTRRTNARTRRRTSWSATNERRSTGRAATRCVRAATRRGSTASESPRRSGTAAADAARQVIEIAAQRYDREERKLSLRGGHVVDADGGSWPLTEVVGLLEDAQILAKGARGPNPAGMQVLTFGAQVAEVAVDVG